MNRDLHKEAFGFGQILSKHYFYLHAYNSWGKGSGKGHREGREKGLGRVTEQCWVQSHHTPHASRFSGAIDPAWIPTPFPAKTGSCSWHSLSSRKSSVIVNNIFLSF